MDTLKQSKRFIFTLHKEENMNYDDFVNLFNELEIENMADVRWNNVQKQIVIIFKDGVFLNQICD